MLGPQQGIISGGRREIGSRQLDGGVRGGVTQKRNLG